MSLALKKSLSIVIIVNVQVKRDQQGYYSLTSATLSLFCLCCPCLAKLISCFFNMLQIIPIFRIRSHYRYNEMIWILVNFEGRNRNSRRTAERRIRTSSWTAVLHYTRSARPKYKCLSYIYNEQIQWILNEKTQHISNLPDPSVKVSNVHPAFYL